MNSIKNKILLSLLYSSLSEKELISFQNKFQNFKILNKKTSFVEKRVGSSSISIFPESVNDFKMQLENNLDFKELINKNENFRQAIENTISKGLNHNNEYDEKIPLFTYTL